jgi:hypothetical protein
MPIPFTEQVLFGKLPSVQKSVIYQAFWGLRMANIECEQSILISISAICVDLCRTLFAAFRVRFWPEAVPEVTVFQPILMAAIGES